jgi:hypothetical protein
MKKAASNELRDLIRKLSDLNKILEKNPDDNTRKELFEARELYNSKYEQFFKKEEAKTTMFKQLNLEKPSKWFLNLSSDKLSTESPSNKLRKYCDKYKDTDEWGGSMTRLKKCKLTYMMLSNKSLMKGHGTRMYQLRTF